MTASVAALITQRAPVRAFTHLSGLSYSPLRHSTALRPGHLFSKKRSTSTPLSRTVRGPEHLWPYSRRFAAAASQSALGPGLIFCFVFLYHRRPAARSQTAPGPAHFFVQRRFSGRPTPLAFKKLRQIPDVYSVERIVK